MLTTIYLDNNVLLDLKNASPGSREGEFLREISARRFRAVLSSTHHLEAARGPDDLTAYKTADFLDSLSPLWLRERTELHKRELLAYLQGTSADTVDPVCLSVSEMASEVARLRGCTQS